MRNRTSIVILCSITVSALLSGCGASNKIPDATIKTAIQDSTNIYSDYNLAIQELSSYYIRVVFIDRSPAECYNSFRVLWIGKTFLPPRRF